MVGGSTTCFLKVLMRLNFKKVFLKEFLNCPKLEKESRIIINADRDI